MKSFQSSIKALKEYLQPLQLAVRFSIESSGKWVLLKIFLIAIQALLPLLSLYILKLIIDSLTGVKEASLVNYVDSTYTYILILGGIGIFGAVISIFSQIVNEKQSFLLQDYIAEIVNTKSLSLDLVYYENPEYLDSFQRAQQEAATRPGAVLNSWTGLLKNGISLAGIATYLIFLNWVIAIVLLIAAIPAFIIKIKFSNAMYEWQMARTQKERESQYLRFLMTSPVNVKEMRIFDMGEKVLRKFRTMRKLLRDERLKIIKTRTFQGGFAKVLETIAITGALLFLAQRTLSGQITIGDLVIYHQAFQKGQSSLVGFLQQIAGLYDHRKFLVNLRDFLAIKPNIGPIENAQPAPNMLLQPIRFEDVSFSYLGQKEHALQNVDLTIDPKQLITIIGENGSGKSTFIKLLSHLYQPTNGKIIAGDIPIDQIAIKDWQNQLSVTFQDFNQYNFSLKDNISIIKLGEKVNYQRLEEVCKITGVNSFLHKLPQGLDSLLGRKFFGGIELSQGQWQRVAIARSLYRQSPILILDEPTSALDPSMEFNLFKFLRKESQHRTIIIISHRVTAAKLSDKVMLIDQSKVIAFGSHDQLYASNHKYQRIFEQQASLLENKKSPLLH